MKDFKKLMVVVLFMLASVSGKIAAYTYTINNQTGQDVKVKLYWGARSPLINWTKIESGERRKLSRKNLNCLNGIDVQRKENGRWQKSEKVELVRKKVPTWAYIAFQAVAVFKEVSYQCGNQTFDLEIDEKGKIVAVKK